MSFAMAAVLTGVLVVSFALLGTLHVALVWGLAKTRRKNEALLALFVPLAAPILGFRAGLRVRAIAYALALVALVVTRLVA